MNVKLVGKRIKERRTELKITQQEIAEKIHVNKSTVQRYESGQVQDIKLPIIESIAHFLSVSPKWLLGLTDEKTYSEEYERVTHLMNLHFRSIVTWSEDELLDEKDTILIREHFYDLLIRYKKILETFVKIQSRWENSKNSLNSLYENRSIEEVKELYLKNELETELQDAVNWINTFPNWIARNEINDNE